MSIHLFFFFAINKSTAQNNINFTTQSGKVTFNPEACLRLSHYQNSFCLATTSLSNTTSVVIRDVYCNYNINDIPNNTHGVIKTVL